MGVGPRCSHQTKRLSSLRGEAEQPSGGDSDISLRSLASRSWLALEPLPLPAMPPARAPPGWAVLGFELEGAGERAVLAQTCYPRRPEYSPPARRRRRRGQPVWVGQAQAEGLAGSGM